jgi:hypothetical protein
MYPSNNLISDTFVDVKQLLWRPKNRASRPNAAMSV